MPRPGPRPYECVRRAWHSDRHQPVRGSLIQEIFRVVNEIHAPATRKNKEWQDKLPVVVLKAEEIMYSKANSEAEYMDLNTLCERANDAINTIIRLDESTETGVSLQPCIEAALILGCTPRSATRSQRNSTPCYYLNATGAEPNCPRSSNLQKETLGAQNTFSPFVSDYSKILTPNNMNYTNPGLKSLPPIMLERNTLIPSIYPLYYGPEPQSKVSNTGVENPFQDISAYCRDSRNKITKSDCGTIFENSPDMGCDLSLRLGPFTHPPSSFNNRQPQEVEGFGSSRKVKNLDQQLNRSFSSSFGSDSADNNLLNASLGKRGSRNWRLNADTTVKKRKGVVNHLYKDTLISCKAKLPLTHHAGEIRSPDPSKSNSKDPALCVNTIQSRPKSFSHQFSIL